MSQPSYLLNEILGQPNLLKNILARQEEIRGVFKEVLEDQTNVTVFGCGDSVLSAQSASLVFDRHSSLNFKVYPALEYITYHYNSKSIAIPISMSGNVDRTVEGLSLAKKFGSPTLAITNSMSGKLAQLADHVIDLGIKEPAPFLSSTSTFSATSLIFTLLATANCQFDIIPVIEQLLEQASHEIKGIQQQLEEIVQSFEEEPNRIYILATGPNLSVASHGAMKLAELADVVAVSQELEEFAHQQFWTLQKSDLVILNIDGSVSSELVEHYVSTLTQYDVKVIIISQQPFEFAGGIPTVMLPRLEHDEFSPLISCIPLQLFAYYWSLRRGYNPNTRVHLRDDQEKFTTSRMLTRKSLVGTGL